MMAQELTTTWIRTVKGNLIVAPGFTELRWVGKTFGRRNPKTFDAAAVSASATSVWNDERTLVGDNKVYAAYPASSNRWVHRRDSVWSNALLTHHSSKLVDVLRYCFAIQIISWPNDRRVNWWSAECECVDGNQAQTQFQ